MFLNKQDKKSVSYYQEMLRTIGSLSRLFSESQEPYIQYRIAENLFCKSFDADNLSRTDCSADAAKNKIGIGIKTFLEGNGATMQKVAEFNSEHNLFRNLDNKEKVIKIAELRNERINATKRIFGLEKMMYHCVTRKKSGILVYESEMNPVDLAKIRNIKAGKNANSISFSDGSNEYSFNVTKSTLYKRFNTAEVLLDFPVKILENPFNALENVFKKVGKEVIFAPIKSLAHVFLPLYSIKNGIKEVPVKSGLNQWNALGRARDANEVYIPIPAWVNSKYPGFFPPRDTSFTLLLPNGGEMSAKVCQDGSKALMSNPNSALGQWLLRDVLDLKNRELLTYGKLEEIGLDSVVLYKTSEGKYDIDFTKIGSFEEFAGEFKNSEEGEPEDD